MNNTDYDFSAVQAEEDKDIPMEDIDWFLRGPNVGIRFGNAYHLSCIQSLWIQ